LKLAETNQNKYTYVTHPIIKINNIHATFSLLAFRFLKKQSQKILISFLSLNHLVFKKRKWQIPCLLPVRAMMKGMLNQIKGLRES